MVRERPSAGKKRSNNATIPGDGDSFENEERRNRSRTKKGGEVGSRKGLERSEKKKKHPHRSS